MDNIKILQEVVLRHIEPEQAAEMMLWNDYKETWKYRFLKWIGREPYRASDIQCAICLHWRHNEDVGNYQRMWFNDNGVVKCYKCDVNRNAEIDEGNFLIMNKETRKKLNEIGCGDNSCIFGPPGGMGTNAGCGCGLNDLSINVRGKICKGIYILRSALEEAEKEMIMLRQQLEEFPVKDDA